ncbi:MAG: transposase [Alphaproteobacteria bacterium]|nr:transposase [Alphaproteobacteria bacterium]
MMLINPIPTPTRHSVFFTVRLRDDSADLLVRHIEILRLSVRLCQLRYPFTIDDAVILPNRVHMIWSLPRDDQEYAKRWKVIKATFVQNLPRQAGADAATAPRVNIWQRRFWDRPILSRQAMEECRDMIRMAPVQAGLVDDPAAWPYSRDARLLAQVRQTAKAPVLPAKAPVLRLVKG